MPIRRLEEVPSDDELAIGLYSLFRARPASRRQLTQMTKRICQLLKTTLLWSAMAACSWAQQPDNSGPSDADWALPYVLVILAIILGVASVCRPGKREALDH